MYFHSKAQAETFIELRPRALDHPRPSRGAEVVGEGVLRRGLSSGVCAAKSAPSDSHRSAESCTEETRQGRR